MPLKNGHLTRQERNVAQAVAELGDVTAAARKLQIPIASARDAMSKPGVQAEMRRRRAARISEGADIAVESLITTIQDAKAPHSARNVAAGIILRYDAALNGDGLAAKEPHEMNADELQRAIAWNEAQRAALNALETERMRVIEGETIAPEKSDIFG